MKSLNTYNYREEVGFNAINYNVSISDDDKIIRIEEDGSLIAELSFALENNTLILNGKDGLEVAEIDLPVALSKLNSTTYDADNKAIDLTFLKTDGNCITFSMDVAELVNVYTAGDGIDISDNMISIKIKDADNNILSVSEEGLDISLDTLAKTSELNAVREKVDDLSLRTTDLANQMVNLSQNVVDGFNAINNNVSNGLNQLNEHIDQEYKRASAAEEELRNKIGELENEDVSIAEEIKSLKATDVDIYTKIGELANDDISIAEEIKSLKDADIAEAEARQLKDEEILAKIGELADGDVSIAEEIEKLKVADEEILAKIGELADGDVSIAEEIEKLKVTDEEILAKIGELADGDVSIAEEIEKLKVADATEAETRETKDNEIIVLLNKEKDERVSSDDELRDLIEGTSESLVNSIELVQDSANNLHYTLMVGGTSKGEINIPEDKMLESVVYDAEQNALIFTWNTSTQQEPTIVDVSDLVDEYIGGDGIVVNRLESGVKVISIPTDKTKYIKINENGQIEWTVDIKKDESKPWVYHFNDKNGNDNKKVIDFTSDYESLISNVQETYAPLTYVDEMDAKVKSEIIGTSGDSHDANTIFGLRAAIAENDGLDESKIKTAMEEAIKVAAEDSLSKDNALRDELKAYTDTSVEELKNYTLEVESVLNQKYDTLGANVSDNSAKIVQLSTGLGSSEYTGGTGLFDELHRMFHELIHGMDENNLNGEIKTLIDKVTALENTMSVLVGGESINGSVANVVAAALREAKQYTDGVKSQTVSEILEEVAKNYQPIGDYVTKLELEEKKYIDETELANFHYVSEDVMNLTLNSYLTKDDAVKTYQPIGKYLTEIPNEYVTESELRDSQDEMKEFVREQDSKLLSKEMADALYQTKNDGYVTLSQLLAKGYATEDQVMIWIDTMVGNKTMEWVDQHYIRVHDGPFVTHEELGAKHYVTESALESKNYVNLTKLNTTLENYTTLQYADQTYASKIDMENLSKSALLIENMKEGDNININVSNGNQVEFSVGLSDNYMFNDIYNQGLPQKGDNLDEVTQKLSKASQDLYNTTDGEMF